MNWLEDGVHIRRHAMHPKAVLFPDGRIRLYFVVTDLDGLVARLREGSFDVRASGFASANFGLRCLVSTNGLNFDMEPSFSIAGLRDLEINAPSVAPLVDGQFRLDFHCARSRRP